MSRGSLREAGSPPLRTGHFDVHGKKTSKDPVAPKEDSVTYSMAAILRKVARGPAPPRNIPGRTRNKDAEKLVHDEEELTDDESPDLPDDILSDWSDLESSSQRDSDESDSDVPPGTGRRPLSYIPLRKDPRRKRESYYTGSDYVSRRWLGTTERTLPKYDPTDGTLRGHKTIPKYYPWWRLNRARIRRAGLVITRWPHERRVITEEMLDIPHNEYDFESDTDDWVDEARALALGCDAASSDDQATAVQSGASDADEDAENHSEANWSPVLITPSKEQLWRRQGRLFHLKGRPPLTKAEKAVISMGITYSGKETKEKQMRAATAFLSYQDQLRKREKERASQVLRGSAGSQWQSWEALIDGTQGNTNGLIKRLRESKSTTQRTNLFFWTCSQIYSSTMVVPPQLLRQKVQ
ncbi:hypothetical protein CALCODRAFT_506475 [Calocera cornea HHB12733]|uniref:Rrn9 domain-containing protein n=1 Tax=Calocera cornea HHB12733 TaxID=1353952 RepID=A0A165IW57_9BASI|nr:hypothetical protein CALCODRAFT_506475 [Calocera cornea HHB12733]